MKLKSLVFGVGIILVVVVQAPDARRRPTLSEVEVAELRVKAERGDAEAQYDLGVL